MAQKIRILDNFEELPLWDAAGERAAQKAQAEKPEEPAVAKGRRIGLFVDAQNVRLECLGHTIESLMEQGELMIRRAFGDWGTELSAGDARVHVKHAVELRQCPRLTRFGKNAADIAMVVDVMDVLSRDQIDVFVLVSSDSDFTPLVQHLKRAGQEVWGYGLTSAPDSLREACIRFEEIRVPGPPTDSEDPVAAVKTGGATIKKKKEAPKALMAAAFSPDELKILKEVIARLGAGQIWVSLSILAQELQASEGWNFERHQGKLGKKIRKLAWMESHPTDTQLVRLVK